MSQPQDDQQNQVAIQQQQQQQPQQQQNQQLMQQQIQLKSDQDAVQQQQNQQHQQQQQQQNQQQQQQQQQQQVMQAGQIQSGQIQQVQVIQNQQTAYLPQLYSGQGGLIMPGNMQIGPMKVITQGQPGTYPTYPGTSNQTLVIGQLFSPQQGLLPAQNNQAKPQDMKPPTQGCVVSSQGQQLTHLISPIQYSNNGRTTVQSNQMQFTPWQFNTLPQGITWASQPPIFIQGRGNQQDGTQQNQQGTPTPMFLQQSPPPQHLQGHPQVAMQQGTALSQLTSTPTSIKTRPEHIQPKTLNTICRPLMPNSVRGGPPLNSTQGNLGPKKRTKQVVIRSPLVIPTQKMMDASNQTKLQTSIHQQLTNNSNKMIIASTAQLIHHQQQQHLTSSVASQQQQQQQQPQQQILHASLSQHMGPSTQLTYTMQQPPQAQFSQQQHMQPKPLIGLPIQTQQMVAPQVQQQQHTEVMSMQQQQQNQQQQQRLQQTPQQSVLPQPQPLPLPNVVSLQTQVNSQQSHQLQQQQQQQSLQGIPTSMGPPAPSATLVDPNVAAQSHPLNPTSNGTPDPHSSSNSSTDLGGVPTHESHPLPPQHALPPSQSSHPPQPSQHDETNGPSNAAPSTNPPSSTAKDSKPTAGSLPKTTALVKPQILTHVIEGFVIQESDQPFPVNRGACFDLIGADDCEEPLAKKLHLDDSTTPSSPGLPPPVASDDRKPPTLGSNTPVANDSNGMGDGSSTLGVPNPLKWTVTEVCDFIRNLPGCAEYVEDFAMQEIDGQALMLLQAKHLMEAMSMKLGPALKIVAKIDSMRQAAEAAAGGPPVTPASTA